MEDEVAALRLRVLQLSSLVDHLKAECQRKDLLFQRFCQSWNSMDPLDQPSVYPSFHITVPPTAPVSESEANVVTIPQDDLGSLRESLTRVTSTSNPSKGNTIYNITPSPEQPLESGLHAHTPSLSSSFSKTIFIQGFNVEEKQPSTPPSFDTPRGLSDQDSDEESVFSLVMAEIVTPQHNNGNESENRSKPHRQNNDDDHNDNKQKKDDVLLNEHTETEAAMQKSTSSLFEHADEGAQTESKRNEAVTRATESGSTHSEEEVDTERNEKALSIEEHDPAMPHTGETPGTTSLLVPQSLQVPQSAQVPQESWQSHRGPSVDVSPVLSPLPVSFSVPATPSPLLAADSTSLQYLPTVSTEFLRDISVSSMHSKDYESFPHDPSRGSLNVSTSPLVPQHPSTLVIPSPTPGVMTTRTPTPDTTVSPTPTVGSTATDTPTSDNANAVAIIGTPTSVTAANTSPMPVPTPVTPAISDHSSSAVVSQPSIESNDNIASLPKNSDTASEPEQYSVPQDVADPTLLKTFDPVEFPTRRVSAFGRRRPARTASRSRSPSSSSVADSASTMEAPSTPLVSHVSTTISSSDVSSEALMYVAPPPSGRFARKNTETSSFTSSSSVSSTTISTSGSKTVPFSSSTPKYGSFRRSKSRSGSQSRSPSRTATIPTTTTNTTATVNVAMTATTPTATSTFSSSSSRTNDKGRSRSINGRSGSRSPPGRRSSRARSPILATSTSFSAVPTSQHRPSNQNDVDSATRRRSKARGEDDDSRSPASRHSSPSPLKTNPTEVNKKQTLDGSSSRRKSRSPYGSTRSKASSPRRISTTGGKASRSSSSRQSSRQSDSDSRSPPSSSRPLSKTRNKSPANTTSARSPSFKTLSSTKSSSPPSRTTPSQTNSKLPTTATTISIPDIAVASAPTLSNEIVIKEDFYASSSLVASKSSSALLSGMTVPASSSAVAPISSSPTPTLPVSTGGSLLDLFRPKKKQVTTASPCATSTSSPSSFSTKATSSSSMGPSSKASSSSSSSGPSARATPSNLPKPSNSSPATSSSASNAVRAGSSYRRGTEEATDSQETSEEDSESIDSDDEIQKDRANRK